MLKNKKMTIAHIVCTFPPYHGGMGNSTFEIVKSINEKECPVEVITPHYSKRPNEDKGLISNDLFKVLRFKPFFSFGNAAVLPQLVYNLKKYDIVHLHYPFFGASEFVMFAKMFSGGKMRLFLHYHMDAQASGIKGSIFRLYDYLILPILIRYSEKITCASINYIKASRISKYYKRNPEKFVEINFGVDTDKFRVLNTNKKNKKTKKILFVGGLDKAHYFKGLEVLLGAMTKFKNKEYTLQIIGNGALLDKYKKQVVKLNLSSKVEFLGSAQNDELIKYYNEANVFVLPSINGCEAFGLVLLEAMACGTPVIASRLPGVDSVFDEGEQGYYVSPNDSEELANKIDKILNNDVLAQSMGNNARRLVERKYKLSSVGDKFIILYK